MDVVGRNRGQRAAGCLLLLVVLLVAGAGPADGSASARAGAWSWPLVAPGPQGPAVLRRFAVLPSPWLPGHRGVDLATAVGAPVLAPADGVVVFAGTVVDRGVLTIEHAGGLRTSYEPVSDAAARSAPPSPAGAGWPRSRPAATTAPTRTCLHWGLRRGETYLDPLGMVAVRPPFVLLPLGTAPGSWLRSARGRRPRAPRTRARRWVPLLRERLDLVLLVALGGAAGSLARWAVGRVAAAVRRLVLVAAAARQHQRVGPARRAGGAARHPPAGLAPAPAAARHRRARRLDHLLRGRARPAGPPRRAPLRRRRGHRRSPGWCCPLLAAWAGAALVAGAAAGAPSIGREPA